MKVRKTAILIIIIIFLLNLTVGFTLAGDESNPEIQDNQSGDGDTDFRDIDKAWFRDEENTTLIYLKLAGAPPDLGTWLGEADTTNYDYEVYFDVNGVGYAAAVQVQYAFTVAQGLFTVDQPWTWEIRKVVYGSKSDVIASETQSNETDGNYDDLIMEWEINKADLGIPPGISGAGVELKRTWAAVWDADQYPSDETRDPDTASDYAHTHYTNPGRTYRITGTGGVDYTIELSADEVIKETPGGIPIEFLVRAYNNGSHEFDIEFFTGSESPGWSINLTPVSSVKIGVQNSRTLTVTVTPPKDVENNTEIYVTIEGNIKEIDGNGTIPIRDTLTLTVVGLIAPSEAEDENWWDIIMDNIAIIAGVIAVVIVAVVILGVLVRRR
jgi:hypothetical protein